MNKKKIRPREPTAVELADEEDQVAQTFEDMGVGEDDASFLHADAAERRRLAAIIAEEEAKEEEETKRWKESIKLKRSKKDLTNS